MDLESLKDMLRQAFSRVEFPGNWCLIDTYEGVEPYQVRQEFSDKTDWRVLDYAFLEQAPAGESNALFYFSIEAFRFYLPAYLIADIDGGLSEVSPVFHLTNGLDDPARSELVNPRRYGARTRFEDAIHTFSVFDTAQVSAIVAYLELKRGTEEMVLEREYIDQALANYWKHRAIGPNASPDSSV